MNRAQTRGFGGLRVVSFESRMAEETGRLVEGSGGVAILAPSMREVPLEQNNEALGFGRKLLAGAYDIIVFMTGVGTRYLFAAMEVEHDRAQLVDALSSTVVVARGPKPVRALGEFKVPITLTVPEPNTWREILEAMAGHDGIRLDGAKVAVQLYGRTNDQFVTALENAGATVETVPVYRWAMPEDRTPLVSAIRQIIGGTADIALFTSANQVSNVFQAAEDEGIAGDLRRSFEELLICSIGPVCSEALNVHGVDVDLEPSHTKLGLLVKETATQAASMLAGKRQRAVTGPTGMTDQRATDSNAFMKACRREPVEHTPVWLMRQAGRYMKEYRQLRAEVSFIELCKRPKLAAEVAVTAAGRIGADAAILFSDILLIVEPMGLGLSYAQGDGPKLEGVVREASDVARLREVDPRDSLAFVFEAVAETRRQLPAQLPLIGFCGAPFTLASYIVEGGSSRQWKETRRFMRSDESAWNAMMALLTRALTGYLLAQVEAGASVLQIFDSWVGCLTPAEYRRYVLPHTTALVSALPADVPVIHFGTGTAELLDDMATAGACVLGVDHSSLLAPVMERHPDLAVQGNLDPSVLLEDRATIETAVAGVLDDASGRPGHIFNLGHGVLPNTPVDNAALVVQLVHELSAR